MSENQCCGQCFCYRPYYMKRYGGFQETDVGYCMWHQKTMEKCDGCTRFVSREEMRRIKEESMNLAFEKLKKALTR